MLSLIINILAIVPKERIFTNKRLPFFRKRCNNRATCTSYIMKDTKQQYTEQFMDCYELYSDDIFRFCLSKTKDRLHALDVTQDTFVKFWEYMSKGNVIDNNRPFLYRIARNLIIDGYRKKKDILVEDFSDGSYQEHLRDNHHIKMEESFDARKTLELLHQLPDTLREIVTLHFVDGFSIQEIAQTTDTLPKTVSVYLHRGVQHLKKILNEYER